MANNSSKVLRGILQLLPFSIVSTSTVIALLQGEILADFKTYP